MEKEILQQFREIFGTYDLLMIKRKYFEYINKLSPDDRKTAIDILQYRLKPELIQKKEKHEKQFKGFFADISINLGLRVDLINEFVAKNKPYEQTQPTFKDYFTPETEESTINEIQSRFKQYNGKKMAILIHLLSNEYKIVNIVPNSKTNSRAGFVKLLTGNDKISMQAIDKWLINGNLNLNVMIELDFDYQNIKKEFEKILQ